METYIVTAAHKDTNCTVQGDQELKYAAIKTDMQQKIERKTDKVSWEVYSIYIYRYIYYIHIHMYILSIFTLLNSHE